MYNNILVTLDCSEVDHTIITHITELAQIHHSHVDLIHILHSHTLDQEHFQMNQSVAIINDYQKQFREKQIPVNTIIKIGEPDEEILLVIEKGNYDLIAMATHGHHFFGDILYGSVSDTLKHKIGVPILLIKGKK